MFKQIALLLILFSVGCAVVPMPGPFVPYKVYDYPPPRLSGRINEPTTLRCIDNSNIYVHSNEAWWWAGPNRGWIPTGGGWYPWPRQVWPDKVYNIYKDEPAPIIPLTY